MVAMDKAYFYWEIIGSNDCALMTLPSDPADL